MYVVYTTLVKYKGYRIEFSQEKNLLLQETRGVCFEDVLEVIERKKIIDDRKSSSPKYRHQRVLVIKIKEYIYAVPYVLDKKRKIVFLKTVYPSRVLTERYLKGGVKK